MEHTPEPWQYDREWDTPTVWSGKPEDGNVRDVIGEGVVNIPDARRIVACVNKLAGWSIKDLENTEIKVAKVNPAKRAEFTGTILDTLEDI